VDLEAWMLFSSTSSPVRPSLDGKQLASNMIYDNAPSLPLAATWIAFAFFVALSFMYRRAVSMPTELGKKLIKPCISLPCVRITYSQQTGRFFLTIKNPI